jgi:hypothetical protein
MLAYSVFSLRLSEDVPSQSDSVHLISLYLTVCMFFSLSAMTWFAIANKLREKKRLPHWLRWFALNYLSYIVCASSMQRKAKSMIKSKAKQSSSSLIPMNSVPLERDYLSETGPIKLPLLADKSSQSAITTNNDSLLPLNPSPSTIWIRRPLTRITSSSNGPETPKTVNPLQTKHSLNDTSSKNQESLYAIHIINRLFFLVFLLLVIVFNIYTWFIYSRSIQTKLLDNQTSWTCFDEERLSVVPCNETS